jgi:ASC-1-like (ASCH) protein
MGIKKHIQLTKEPLETLIKNGESVDFRLDEPAWEDLMVGDTVEFWEDFSGWDKEPSTNSRKVVVKIVEIFRAASFSELIDTLPKSFNRQGTKEHTIADLRQWWTPEREKQTGVLGWRVEVI